MLSSKAKVARILSIFVLAGLLFIVSIARVFVDTDGYRKQLLGFLLVFLFAVLVCAMFELAWKPLRDDANSNASSGDRQNDGDTSTSMEVPLAYSEEPPAYEDVVGTNLQMTTISEIDPSSNSGLGAVVATLSSTGGSTDSPELNETQDLPDAEESSAVKRIQNQHQQPEEMPHNEGNEDDLEEVYVPRRFSPFLPDTSPVPGSHTNSRELSLAVDCLPTYEEAVTALNQQGTRQPSGSDASYSDSNLILFI